MEVVNGNEDESWEEMGGSTLFLLQRLLFWHLLVE
jgi:hypothetical protein